MTTPIAANPAIDQRRQRRREDLLAILALVISLLFMYRDVVFQGRTFLMENSTYGTMPLPLSAMGPYGYTGPQVSPVNDPLAISAQIEPWDRFITRTLQAGQLPLWNPHQGLGVPLHANGHSALFDPINLLVWLSPPAWWPVAMDFQLLLRFFIGGLFTYLFIRSLGVGLAGALGAAFAFMFSSYFIYHGNIAYTRVEVLLPLVLYAYDRLARHRTTAAFGLAAFATFLLFDTEFAEVVPLQLGLGLAWYGFRCLLEVQRATDKRRLAIRIGLPGILATLVGALASAFILLPFLQTLRLGATIHDSTVMVSTPPSAITVLGGVLIALGGGLPTWGAATAVLGIFGISAGLANRRDSLVRQLAIYACFFLGAALFILLVMIRAPGFGWLASLPIINMINLGLYPYLEVIFCGACGAGIGLHILLSPGLKRRLVFGVASALCVLAATVFFKQITDTVHANLGTRIIPVLFMFFFVVVMADRVKWGLRLAGPLLALLVVVEQTMLLWPPAHPSRYEPYMPPPFVTYLQGVEEPFRIVGTEGVLYPNVSTAYGLDDIRYLDALNPRDYDTFRERFLDSIDTPTIETLTRFDGVSALLRFGREMDVLNVKYILTTSPTPPPRPDPGETPFELVHTSTGVYVYRNNDAYPRAFAVHQAEVIPENQAALDRFADPAFNPRQTVILGESLPADQQAALASQTGGQTDAEPITVTSPDVNAVKIEAKLDRPGLVVLSDLYYPGWEAYVDGKPAPIYKADTILRAVYLEAGAHLIEYFYRPPLFVLGLLIALGTVLAVLIIRFTPGIWRRVRAL